METFLRRTRALPGFWKPWWQHIRIGALRWLLRLAPSERQRVFAAMKLMATVFCYSSGGAGGILAPALFIGGMLGGAFGYADVGLFHHDPSEIGAFALVAIGAAFAGIILLGSAYCYRR